jgi:hypothetical protein
MNVVFHGTIAICAHCHAVRHVCVGLELHGCETQSATGRVAVSGNRRDHSFWSEYILFDGSAE